jgi:predicted small metal-binding protein
MASGPRKFQCECGFQVVAHKEEELVEIVQFHMKGSHHRTLSAEAILAAQGHD